jgi:hypothetical protein
VARGCLGRHSRGFPEANPQHNSIERPSHHCPCDCCRSSKSTTRRPYISLHIGLLTVPGPHYQPYCAMRSSAGDGLHRAAALRTPGRVTQRA